MNLAKLMDELAIAARSVQGIARSFAYPPEKVEPPAILVAWPENIVYDATYEGGMSELLIPLFLVIGQGGTSWSRRDDIAGWLGSDVKIAIEAYPYTDSPVVVITEAIVDVVEIANIGYLAVKFMADVTVTN